MKNKKIVVIISIALAVLIISLVTFIILNNIKNQKLENKYKKYLTEYTQKLEKNENIKFKKNKDENINVITKYIETIKNNKKEIEELSYDKYIESEEFKTFYSNLSNIENKIKEQQKKLEEIENEIIRINSKKYLYSYLKKSKCSKLCINAVKKVDKGNKINNNINNYKKENNTKYNTILEYISYLNENKDNWSLNENIITVKNDDVLNMINQKNTELGFKYEVKKYVEPKIEVNTSSNSHILPIFMYHGVSDNPWGITSLFMPIAKFDEQMKYLHDNGYKTILPNELDSITDYSKTVMLTFDDGYEDFYLNAFPILKKYNIKATLYTISDYVGAEIYANAVQIKELSDSGLVAIESHTVSHASLNQLSNEDIERELSNSKQALESITGKTITSIAYPKGHYDNRVLELTKKYYKYGFLAGGGVQPMDSSLNNVAIKRIGVYSSITYNAFTSYCSQAK